MFPGFSVLCVDLRFELERRRILQKEVPELQLGGVLILRQKGNPLFRPFIDQIRLRDYTDCSFTVNVKFARSSDDALVCDVVTGLHDRQDDRPWVLQIPVYQTVDCVNTIFGLFFVRDLDDTRQVNDQEVQSHRSRYPDLQQVSGESAEFHEDGSALCTSLIGICAGKIDSRIVIPPTCTLLRFVFP
jgi:hypothetical protein